MADDGYRSPLGTRYASPAMQTLWGERHRVGLWRRLWLALAEAERELGLDIPERAIPRCARISTTSTSPRPRAYERRFRHDVMAHVHAFGDAAPAARAVHPPRRHQRLRHRQRRPRSSMREGCGCCCGAADRGARRAGGVRAAAAREPCPAGLHALPAGPAHHRRQAGHALDAGPRPRPRGARPPDRDAALPRRARARPARRRASSSSSTATTEGRELDRRVAASMGFSRPFPVTGQTYTRKARRTGARRAEPASRSRRPSSRATSGCCSTTARAVEPFEAEQIGSSAPWRTSAIRCAPSASASLARFVIVARGERRPRPPASQWLERTLDDSANRRLALPEAFLATDADPDARDQHRRGARGASEPRSAAHVAEQMPFMATESCSCCGVRAGGDRQALHEMIRRHSLAVARAVKRRRSRTTCSSGWRPIRRSRGAGRGARSRARAGALRRPGARAGGRVPRRSTSQPMLAARAAGGRSRAEEVRV